MLNDLFSMKDKTCVVTGGSRGLGYFMAEGFLAAGAKRVYITARKAEACEAAAKELSEFGECIALPGDLSSLEGENTSGNWTLEIHDLQGKKAGTLNFWSIIVETI